MKIVTLAFVLLASCAVIAENSRMDELRDELDPLKGKLTQQRCVDQWGPPDKRDTMGQGEYWTYYRGYGAGRERTDRVVLEFREGKLYGWTADIRR